MKLDAKNIKKVVEVWTEDKYNLILLGIFILALAIRLRYAFVSGLWWDEARYAEIGRELLSHPFDYSAIIEGGGPITVFEPLLPYLLFLSQAILGAGEFAVRIVNPILSSIAAVAIFYLGKLFFNKKVGLISAALLSVSPIFLFNNVRILIETPEVAFMILTLTFFFYGIEKKNKYVLWAAGAVGALAYLARISSGFLIFVILAYLFVTQKTKWIKNKNIWICAIIALLVLTPWMFRNMNVCDNPFCEMSRGIKTITPSVGEEEIGHTIGGYQFELFNWVGSFPILLSMGVLLFFIFGLLLSVQARKKGDILMLLWIVVVLAVMSQIYYVGQLRRILWIIPPIILLASRAIDNISTQLTKGKGLLPYILIVIIVVPLMFLSFQDGENLIVTKAPGFLKLKDAGLHLKDMPEEAKILAGSLNQITFYSNGRNTTNYFPDNQEDLAKTIKEHNYDYVVMDGYEPTQPQWIFNYVQQQQYLTVEKIIYEGENPIVMIFKVNKDMI